MSRASRKALAYPDGARYPQQSVGTLPLNLVCRRYQHMQLRRRQIDPPFPCLGNEGRPDRLPRV